MWRLKTQKPLRLLVLALKKIIESVLIVIALCYAVLVFDIYINTEKLNKVDSSFNDFCQNIARNPKFTKGPVIFRVDRGTLVYRLNAYVDTNDLDGYSPFFIFPHHRTVIISEKIIKREYLDVLVAHELGHIQGGLAFWGKVRDMEKYADNFAVEIVGSERFNLSEKYLQELYEKESQK